MNFSLSLRALSSVMAIGCAITSSFTAETVATMNVRVTAPGDPSPTRLDVGPGEYVDFTAVNSQVLEWKWRKYPSGTYTYSTGTTLTWRAPFLPGPTGNIGMSTFEIEAKKGDSSGTYQRIWMMNVLPPRNQFHSSVPATFSNDNAGCRELWLLRLTPSRVSFTEIEIQEGACVASNVTGFYVPHAHAHAAGVGWNPLNAQNGGLQDNIGTLAPGYAPNWSLPGGYPFTNGTWDWNIPQWYRLVGTTNQAVYQFCLHTDRIYARGDIRQNKNDGCVQARTPSTWAYLPAPPKN